MKDKQELQAEALRKAEASLYQAVVSLRNVEECDAFFHDLCTPAELQAFIDRWAVVCLLRKGMTYRDINEQTGVSVTTVGRVARFLADGYGGYQKVAERLGTEQ
ncbi:MAG: YerC/YecD family TrpR-related protein [Gammaproteobacteria bacterium]